MRSQLQKFTDFANTLLPHETEYLLSVQEFQDEERLALLRQVDFNAHHIGQFTPYDTSIDKRKYNHLQNWIATKLKSVDVDEQFNWILDMEQKIMTDTIGPVEEKELLKAIRNYEHPHFSFIKFYEVVEHYRHFLLVRIRYNDHELVDGFLKKYKSDYLKSKEIYEDLHQATLDIVGQYSGEEKESGKWKKWLETVFYNEKIEGQIRYLALVRLVFIAHNYRKYNFLRKNFDQLDQFFSKGKYYSKRHLLNYYSNRLMLHSNFREYEEAAHFGYLSVRAKTHDHLLYVNNLCAVLLRMNRQQEALQLMKKSSAIAKKTKNFHNRVGYVAFYMEALNKNGMYKNAIGYGESFLKAYKKEVLQYRWHLFFTVYLEALMQQEQFETLLKIAQKYKLSERDKSYQSNAAYLPAIPFYIEAAKYKEGATDKGTFIAALGNFLEIYKNDPGRLLIIKKWLEDCKGWLPEAGLVFDLLK